MTNAKMEYNCITIGTQTKRNANKSNTIRNTIRTQYTSNNKRMRRQNQIQCEHNTNDTTNAILMPYDCNRTTMRRQHQDNIKPSTLRTQYEYNTHTANTNTSLIQYNYKYGSNTKTILIQYEHKANTIRVQHGSHTNTLPFFKTNTTSIQDA